MERKWIALATLLGLGGIAAYFYFRKPASAALPLDPTALTLPPLTVKLPAQRPVALRQQPHSKPRTASPTPATPRAVPTPAVPAPVLDVPATAPPKAANLIDWSKQRVLLVGDSLSVGLKNPLGSLLKEAGATFEHVGRVGSRIDQWASDKKDDGKNLNKVLASFKPTVVIVSLGTNDEAPRKIKKQYDVWKNQQAAFKVLTAKFGNSRVLWLGPPDNDFMDPAFRKSMAAAVGEDAYFVPPADLKKGKDRLHPIPAAYKQWAAAAMDWLKTRTDKTGVSGLGNLAMISRSRLRLPARLRPRATQPIPLPPSMRAIPKTQYGIGQRPTLRPSNVSTTPETQTKPVPIIVVSRPLFGFGYFGTRPRMVKVIRATRPGQAFEPETF